jgi:hypothetical protein
MNHAHLLVRGIPGIVRPAGLRLMALRHCRPRFKVVDLGAFPSSARCTYHYVRETPSKAVGPLLDVAYRTHSTVQFGTLSCRDEGAWTGCELVKSGRGIG